MDTSSDGTHPREDDVLMDGGSRRSQQRREQESSSIHSDTSQRHEPVKDEDEWEYDSDDEWAFNQRQSSQWLAVYHIDAEQKQYVDGCDHLYYGAALLRSGSARESQVELATGLQRSGDRGQERV
ncbi:hypothetical protein OC842_003944 [Tilletia horrida]|uniref:Uncharacterized protein n=1 Tax=Tilletia horrida TaxID=155126 RepID=A0AAN6GD58_9BASI|nr:hypothetical protein OC842_003944 [Tilletia horrida]